MARTSSLPRWRRDAIRRMRATRKATLAFVAGLPEAEIARPRTQGAWSVKDMLAHFLSCDEETVRRFALIARNQADRIQWFESLAYADRFNAREVARLKRVGARALLRRMARVHADLVDRFERLPIAALDDRSHAYPMVEWLPAPGWSHERDHVSEAKAWWRGERTRRPG